MTFSRIASFVVLGLGLALPSLGRAQASLADTLAALGAAPCEDSSLTCLTLPMPVDHLANDPDKTVDIIFAVSLATEESKGVLIYAVGGPGYSGLSVAEGYLSAYDPALVAQMDIVFFDQRGIGPVHGFDCPVAEAAYFQADLSLDTPDLAITAAQTFVTDCLAETPSTDLLPFATTDQAVRDIEMFRQAIGAPKLWVYGESYGTQFVQTYATLFPDSVKGVIVDGVVDLNLGFEPYYDVYTNGAEDVLSRVLAACADIEGCADDMQGDAASAYDNLAARLAAGPVSVSLAGADGAPISRDLTAAMLENNAFYALYDPTDRAALLRTLAAAARGDLVPMLELSYSNLSIDIETGEAASDGSWYGAAYFAITCTDYSGPEATPEEKAQAIIAAAQARNEGRRLPRSYYAEPLACAFWPAQGSVERPAPFAGGDFPTVVMTSDSDPITPLSMAQSVFDNVQNGVMIVMEGGPHVIWGRGLDCPDTAIAALLTEGTVPESQTCSQEFVEGYEPLTLTDPADAADPLTVAAAIETELAQSLRLAWWDGETDLTVGCNFGGTVSVSATEEGSGYTFAACAFWPEIVADGTGLLVADGLPGDGLRLDLTISGRHEGTINYASDYMDGTQRIGGTYDGEPIPPQ